MIEIDGRTGEGGGQILRTGLALSVLTGTPFRIHHVRAGRKPPGMKPQHILSARAAAAVSAGRLSGDEPGSEEVSFVPGRVRAGEYDFDVNSVKASAGSTGLVLQTLLPAVGFADGPSRIELRGGTHVPWSPTADYLRDIFLPAVHAMGIRARMETPQCGFYPIGGGLLDISVDSIPHALAPLQIDNRGALRRLRILSLVANLPRSIADRQLKRALERLAELGYKADGESGSVPSPGRGTSLFITAEYDGANAGFSSLGAVGQRAERVADEAVEEFLQFDKGPGALDPHLADQIVLYMALARGESSFTVAKITNHLKTNIWVIEQFLPVRFLVEEAPSGGPARVRVRGIGFP